MKKSGVIYIITNLINNKKYIGLTTTPISVRYRGGWAKATHNTYLKRSVQKYGQENFILEVFCSCLDTKELNRMEQKLIADLKTNQRQFGYNISGGGSSFTVAQETKDRLSVSNKQAYVNNPNLSSLVSKAVKDAFAKIPNYSVKLSTRQKELFAANPQYVQSMKQSLRDIYRNNPNKRDECATTQGSEPFLIFNKTGVFIGEWVNKTRCAEALGVRREHIRDCLSGKRNCAGKFVAIKRNKNIDLASDICAGSEYCRELSKIISKRRSDSKRKKL